MKRVTELDGVRGLAASSVLGLHIFNTAAFQYKWAGGRPEWFAVLDKFMGLGTYGVDVFFVLSGFLISSLLLERRDSEDYFKDFYWKRVLRIQPVYVLHLVISWFLFPTAHMYVLLAMLFIVNFGDRFHTPLPGPAWTLSIEEQFYLLWPLVVRRASVRAVKRTAWAGILFSAVLRFINIGILHHANVHFTVYRMDGLCFGAILACQSCDGEAGRELWWHHPLILWSAILYEVIGFWFTTPPWVGSFFLLSTNYLAYRLIRCCVVHRGSPWLGFFRLRPLLFLGAISYGLYMYHFFFITLYDEHVPIASMTISVFAERALMISVCSLVFATISLYVMELPVQSLRKLVLTRKKVQDGGRALDMSLSS